MNKEKAIKQIADYTSYIFGVDDIKAECRQLPHIHARSAVSVAANENLGMTDQEIASFLDKDRVTIINARKKYEIYYRFDGVKQQFDSIASFAKKIRVADVLDTEDWRDRYIVRLTNLCRSQHDTILNLNAKLSK